MDPIDGQILAESLLWKSFFFKAEKKRGRIGKKKEKKEMSKRKRKEAKERSEERARRNLLFSECSPKIPEIERH